MITRQERCRRLRKHVDELCEQIMSGDSVFTDMERSRETLSLPPNGPEGDVYAVFTGYRTLTFRWFEKRPQSRVR